MALEKCPKCGFMHYRTDPCRAPADAAPMLLSASAGLPAPDKKQRGRPKTITDMKAYKAQKARERRAAAKAPK